MTKSSALSIWLALTLAFFCSAGLAKAQQRRPNVVLIFTDDQGTLDANCYGSTDLHTPAIDELARKGVRFTQAYAHAVCCPSRALLLTGRHPQRSGIVNWTQGSRKSNEGNPTGTNLPESEVTLAEALRAGGYHTALFGKWHLGARDGQGPIDQGFDQFVGHLGGFIDNHRHFFLHGKGFHDLYDQKQEIFRRGEYFPDLITDRAIAYIDEHLEDPFFLYLAFNIPHYPEQPDAKFVVRYRELEMPRRSYAAMVSTVDDRIGKVLEKLKDTGLRDDTIVVFMSDNGHSKEDKGPIDIDDHASEFPKGHYYSAHGGGGNTGKWVGQKGSFLEGGIRVPAIISYTRRLPQNVVRDQAIIAADWFPTLLDLCGVDRPDVKLDGKSLLPLIESDDAPSPHDFLHWGWQRNWAIRQGPWKLLGVNDQPRQLFNLDDDQPERKNHIKEKPDLAATLFQRHRQWLEETRP